MGRPTLVVLSDDPQVGPTSSSAALVLFGVLVFDSAWAGVWIALLPAIASLLAWRLPPTESPRAASPAGTLLVLAYLLLGAGIFFCAGGELVLELGERAAPLLGAILITTRS